MPQQIKTFTQKQILEAAENGQQGAAALFTLLNKEKLCLDKQSKKWFLCQDGVWKEDILEHSVKALDEVKNLFLDELERLLESRSKAIVDETKEPTVATKSSGKTKFDASIASLQKAARALSDASYRRKVLDMATVGADSLAHDGSGWDSAQYVLPCPNGMLNLKTGRFRALRAGDYVRKTTSVEYDKAATCPLWREKVLEIFGNDKELADFFQRAVGYSVCRHPKEDKLFILFGKGRNGKSLLCGVISRILGDLSENFSPLLLLDTGKPESVNTPTPAVLKLQGAGFCPMSEFNQGQKFDEAKLKSLTSAQDKVTGRLLHSNNIVSFFPTHVFFMLTNRLPHASSDDFALWQRLVAIPFKISYVENPEKENERLIDFDLESKLREEFPGILNWIIEGAQEWIKSRLGVFPQQVKEAIRTYRRSEDFIQDFIDERCFIGPKAAVTVTSLYESYRTWAVKSGIKSPLNRTAFSRQIELNYTKERQKAGICFLGIGLLSNEID